MTIGVRHKEERTEQRKKSAKFCFTLAIFYARVKIEVNEKSL